MKAQRIAALSCAWVLGLTAGCATATASDARARFAPPAGQTLLIIGQELKSVADYVEQCKSCPTPAGVTTYLGFYDLLSARDGFGGLGEDAQGKSAPDADWGAGKTSAARMLGQHPHSALVIGLDMSNGRRSGGLAEIARGVHDDKIARLAAFFIAAKRPIYLRIGYEFDGMWNQGYESRATYIAAYRHIVDGLRARKVTNVAYVWQASASPIDDILEQGHHENIRDWYPGAELRRLGRPVLVPAAAIRHRAPASCRCPASCELAQEVLDLARAEHKPVMIAESTPQGYDLTALTRANVSPVWDGAARGDLVTRTPEQIWARMVRAAVLLHRSQSRCHRRVRVHQCPLGLAAHVGQAIRQRLLGRHAHPGKPVDRKALAR